MSSRQKRALIDESHAHLSISEQCKVLELARSSYYFEPAKESEENLLVMRRIDELMMEYPFYGSRQLCRALEREGLVVNRKRMRRLMQNMGLEAVYCKPRTTLRHPEHKVYPYLLRNVAITSVRQVYSIDITYIRMTRGFLYLTAVLDWYSRYVVSWELSNSMTSDFCIETLVDALKEGHPKVFNSDQGAQFTDQRFVKELLDRDIAVSMDGRGRALDNVFIERLWRTVKYEEVYLKEYLTGTDAKRSLAKYFRFYNELRPHSSLDGATPAEIFYARQ